jgi:hypothetical protein
MIKQYRPIIATLNIRRRTFIKAKPLDSEFFRRCYSIFNVKKVSFTISADKTSKLILLKKIS